MSWKLTALASKDEVEAALETRDANPGWDDAIVLTGFEVDPQEPDTWRLDAYLPGKPNAAQRKAVKALFAGAAPHLVAEELSDLDWVTESQKGIPPIRAGRFHVHTPDHSPANDAGAVNFCIPAAQAFGTGHHETTAGCLEMLQHMRAHGVTPRTLADIGTGTGLLAFAALALWPHADATASDIDPVCLPAVEENAQRNGVRMGTMPGQLAMTIADGMDDELLQQRAPFDLLIANILAAPLIAMADDFSDAVAERGNVLLAGLLTAQEARVRAAWRRAGFRLQHRLVRGDWSILWLRKRYLG